MNEHIKYQDKAEVLLDLLHKYEDKQKKLNNNWIVSCLVAKAECSQKQCSVRSASEWEPFIQAASIHSRAPGRKWKCNISYTKTTTGGNKIFAAMICKFIRKFPYSVFNITINCIV